MTKTTHISIIVLSSSAEMITPLQAKSSVVHHCLFRNKMIKNWGVIGGIAAAIAAGVYVLWGPITERKKRKRGKDQYDRVGHGLM